MMIPNDFIQRMSNMLGSDFDNFIEALNSAPINSLRKNPNKNFNFENCEPVAWCNSGFYLEERPVYTLDPNFHAGAYYVQEASSMFLEQAVKQYFTSDEKITALDLCAAPGGKSTHLLSLLPENSMLVANETIRSRAKILYENILKWGKSNAVVTNNDPKNFSAFSNFFDLILVDAPCSGEGMFRKDNAAANEWSVDNVNLCVQRQQRILADVWNALKPNGILIYCTCTYNIHENEEQVKFLVNNYDATSLKVETKAEWNISESLLPNVFSYRFYPHKTKGEGFCLSVVRKGENGSEARLRNEKITLKILPKNFDFVRNYIRNSENFSFYLKNNDIVALPKNTINEIMFASNKLNTLYSGITLGEIKGKDFVPSQALALSVNINTDAFPKIELDKNEALKFLKKENINNIGNLRGYNLVCYNGNALGWIKNIGNRANNLYPQEWKIRMAIS